MGDWRPEDPEGPAGLRGGIPDDGVPRRVRHLVLLPGGAQPGTPQPDLEPEANGGATGTASPTGEALEPGFRTFYPTGYPEDGLLAPVTAGSLATQAVAEALPHEAPSSHNLKLRLRVITRTVTSPKAPGLPFIVFASILVGLAVLGMVFLRVMVDQASFKVDDLNARVTSQQGQLTQLRYAVSVQEAPDRIAQKAAGLGLVPAGKVQPLAPQTPTSTARGG